MKLAYVLLQIDIEDRDTFNWSQLWRLAGLPKGPLLLWMLAHDQLKTRSLLWQRHV